MNSDRKLISLPKKVYEDELKGIIERNLNKSSDEFEIVCSPGSSSGDGYVGEMYRIKVLDKQTNESKLNLIVKLPPENPIRRDEMFLRANVIFTREALFYNDVYPMYRKFQEEKGIDVEKDGFHHVPICYKALTEEPNEGLFLEDLNVKEFQMFDFRKDVTRDHVLLVMKTLAKMHAIFFCIKDQNPELIKEYQNLKDLFIMICERENSPMDPWYENIKKQALKVIHENGDIELTNKIENLIRKKFSELVKNCFDREKTEPYAILCHGDCWNNNMLFRFENGTPTDLRFLDFQVIRYASPVCDIVTYMFCGVSKALRDQHYQEFLDAYYEELTAFIRRLGSNPEDIFPRKAFEAHLKQFGHFGLIMSLMALPILTKDKNDIPDMDKLADQFKKLGESGEMDENEFEFTKITNHDKYSERLLGVCNSMRSLEYI